MIPQVLILDWGLVWEAALVLVTVFISGYVAGRRR